MPSKGQIRFPAEPNLHPTPNGPRLSRWPATGIDAPHGAEHRRTDVPVGGGLPLVAAGEQFDVAAEVDVGTAAEVGLSVRGEPAVYAVNDRTLTARGTAALRSAWAAE